jgi:hypothetical protein
MVFFEVRVSRVAKERNPGKFHVMMPNDVFVVDQFDRKKFHHKNLCGLKFSGHESVLHND